MKPRADDAREPRPCSSERAGALRVGILCHPTYGGSGVLASELALTLAERGHCVHLFSSGVPPRLARASGPVEMHVAQGFPYPLFQSPPHDLAITSSILDVHRSGGLDILHAHYAIPHAVSGYLARAAALADHGRPAPKLVTTLHGTDITLVGSDPSYAPLTQFVITQSDAVTAVSHDLARRTSASFRTGMPGEPCGVRVVYNFVDVDIFRPLEQQPRLAGPANIVHVSNFRPVKRVPWLLRAFARARLGADARLTLVGDGPDMQPARALVAELGLGASVSFLGERDALPELLSGADVFALSSSEESFGLSALEAMACATPVVATRVGGVGEVVEDGIQGLLVEVDDLEGFAGCLRRLVQDRELARKLGAASRTRAVEHFERHHVVEQYESLYRELLGPA
ncbi:MAG: N-acetyl-alpha-D-glucosaminyl L-malate synthase BshA [Planctomycetes bacterium]|nr:N-acetyl-alpha-D-glucosaminyl L-malate synthase BshA [Planctomycetota bacterium]